LLVLAGLAIVLGLQRAITGFHRTETQAVVLERLTAGLLRDREGMADAVTPDREMALVEGMYAAERIVGQRTPELLGDVPACLALGVIVVVREPPVVVVGGCVAIGAGAMAVLLVRNLSARHADRVWRAFLPALDDLFTAIQGRLEVVGNGVEGRLFEGLGHKLGEWKAASRTAGAVSLVAGRAPVVVAAAAAGLFILQHGGYAAASLAPAALLASVVPPFAALARGVTDLRRDLVRAAPAVSCIETSRESDDRGDACPALPADVTWSAVTFAYPGQSPALRQVDATWRFGELLGVGGQNGSGKSTLVRLLLGLHPPSRGAVTVGGVDVSRIRGAALRSQVAYLVQRPFLPERVSIREAIRLLAPDASDSAIEQRLQRLGLLTVLAARGGVAGTGPLDVAINTLSAGERQRVAIARVLLREAPLLVLDEPDANLDADGVRVVAETIREEAGKRMVLFIAHSPTLLDSADRVLHFEAGQLIATEAPRAAEAACSARES
jgi:ABC-type multidrug transport system fused ATPase/permease subunit